MFRNVTGTKFAKVMRLVCKKGSALQCGAEGDETGKS